MYSTPGKSQPLSGHGFTTCFTACKPLKKSVILTSRVLHRHFWWKKVIVSYLSMNLATHSILYFSHLFFNTNLNVLKYEGFIWCYIYNWLVISIFFHNCNIHVYHSKFHVNIFLLIYYDQKTLEFNSFKMTIYGVYSVDRTCKYWIEKEWSIYAMDCIADKPSGCKSKTYCVAIYMKCQSLCQISVSRGDWWAVQKPMCIETWNCWLLCLTYNKE